MTRRSIASPRLFAGLLLAALVMMPGVAVAKSILIYGPSLSPAALHTEGTLALAAGHAVTVWDAATWAGKTTNDFKAFDAIVFGDPNCPFSPSPTLDAAVLNRAVWSAALTGPIVVNGTDPVFHAGAQPGARQMITSGINFAALGPGTGLYVSLSCYYFSAPAGTIVDLLADLGTFQVQGNQPEAVEIVQPNHPAMGGLTNTNLSNWGNSIHETFTLFPPDFTILARAAFDQTPYVIARPSATLINFDVFPDGTAVAGSPGTIVTNQYGSVGAIFSSSSGGPVAVAGAGVASSQPNFLVGNPTAFDPITIDLVVPGTLTQAVAGRVDLTLIGVGNAVVTATALAANLTTGLAQQSITHPGTGDGATNKDTVSLVAAGISRVKIAITTPSGTDGFGIDDVIIFGALTSTGQPLQADLSATKLASPEPVAVGSDLTYTITVTNNGPSSAVNTILVDTLPPGVSFVSASSTQASCSGVVTITCAAGALGPGSSATVTLVVHVTATGGTLTNSVTVSSDTTDPVPGNNSATATSTVISGSISGKVIQAGGVTPIAGAIVTTAEGPSFGTATTGPDGTYTITGLLPGTYKVSAVKTGFQTRWFNDQPSSGTANLVNVTAGATTPNIDFSLKAGAGGISGTVFQADGVTPIPFAGISISLASGGGVLFTTANGSGVYNTGLTLAPGTPPAGGYKVQASVDGFASFWYNQALTFPAATAVGVINGATTLNIDFKLPAAGGITGQITNADTGAGLSGANVEFLDGAGNFVVGVRTAPDGTYASGRHLAAGSYKVRARRDGFVATLYNGKTTVADADAVVVAVNLDTPNINIALPVAGGIRGTITRTDTGVGVANATVTVVDATIPPPQNNFVASTTTLADGTYTVPRTLRPGTYKVQARAPGLLQTFHLNSVDFFSATAVAVTAGFDTLNIDIALAPGASIVGTILDRTSSLPISGATVTTFRVAGNSFSGVTSTVTDGNGQFALTELRAGEWIVRAFAPGHQIGHFSGDPDNLATDSSSATPIVLTAGGSFTGANMNLALGGGTISGRITRSDTGAPAPPGTVISVNGLAPRLFLTGAVMNVTIPVTTTDGTYSIGGLPPGSYIVSASGQQVPGGTAFGFFPSGATGVATAVPVSVTSGTTTAGVDFALQGFTAPDAPRTISGTVRDTAGNPIVFGVNVAVIDPFTQSFIRSFNVNGDGTYTISQLPPGLYLVRAQTETTFQTTTYPGQHVPAAGAEVNVTTTSQTGINFTMPSGAATLTGTIVRSDTNQPILGASIQVRNFSDNPVTGIGVSSRADGTFLVRGLTPGFYKMRVSAPGFITRHYTATVTPSGGLVFDDASFITATGGQNTPGVNVALDPGGAQIKGRIFRPAVPETAAPLFLADAAVQIREATSGATVFSAISAVDGTWESPNLPPGSYKLLVRATGFAAQWSGGQNTREAAATVIVPGPPTPVTAPDIVMSPDFGTFSGHATMTDESPLADVGIVFFDAVTQGFVAATGVTNVSGGFAMRFGLKPGQYHVQARALGFSRVFYVNGDVYVPDQDHAGSLTLSKGFDTGGVVFRLKKTSDIQGTISYAGNRTGKLKIGLFGDADLTDFRYGLTVNDPMFPQAYTFASPAPDTQGILPGTYYVAAFLDTNDNGVLSLGEPGGRFTAGAVTVAEGATASGKNFTLVDPTAVTIDARALSSPNFSIRNSAGEVLASQSTASVLSVQLLPGSYVFRVAGNSFTFNMLPNGTLDFNETLAGFLAGSGTTTLKVNGFVITVDARTVPTTNYTLAGATTNEGDFIATTGTATVRTYNLIPGAYNFLQTFSLFYPFTLSSAGAIDFAPTLDATLVGRGTNRLTVGPAGTTVRGNTKPSVLRPSSDGLPPPIPNQPAGSITISELRVASLGTTGRITLTLPPGVTFTTVPRVVVGLSTGLSIVPANDAGTGPKLENGSSVFSFALATKSTLGPGSLTIDDIRYTVAANAALGDVFVVVTGPGVEDAAANATVVAASNQPSLASVAPTSAGQGALGQKLTLTGANFQDGATVTFLKADPVTGQTLDPAQIDTAITVGAVTVSPDSLQLTVTINVDPFATPGYRTIRVTNPSGFVSDLVKVFQVSGKPTIAAITTNRADNQLSRNLTVQPVTITGTGFQAPPGLSITFSNPVTGFVDPLITVGEVQYVNETTVTTDVTIAADAAIAVRTLVLTNPDGGVASASISVFEPPADEPAAGLGAPASKTTTTTAPPPPSITNVTPSSGLLNSTATINGANFSGTLASNSVTFAGPSSTRVAATVSTASTTQLSIRVPATAVDGPVTVAVNGVVSNGFNFTVTSPRLSGVVPASGVQNTSLTLDLTGTKFVSGATVSFPAASGVSVAGTVVFVDATHLRVPVTIAVNAPVGLVDVTVTNPTGGGTSTLTGGFQVKQAVAASLELSLVGVADPATFLPSVNAVSVTLDATGKCTFKSVTPHPVAIQAAFRADTAALGGVPTPPANVTFTITPSNVPGTATNEDCEIVATGAPATNDFSFSLTDTSVTQTAPVADAGGGVYLATLYSWDWGGNVIISVRGTMTLPDGVATQTVTGTLTLPVDTDNDGLPDAYEKDAGLNANAAGANVLNFINPDQDGNGVLDRDDRFARDGLSNFAKYRGIYLQGPVNGTAGAMTGLTRLGAGLRHLFVRGSGFGDDPLILANPGTCGVNPGVTPIAPTTDPFATSAPCPTLAVGGAFTEVGVLVHNATSSFSVSTGTTVTRQFPAKSIADTTKTKLDLLTIFYDAFNCPSTAPCDHMTKTGVRQFQFPTLGFSTFGTATTYGSARVFKRSVEAYFNDKPYEHRINDPTRVVLGADGRPMLAPITIVGDSASTGTDNGAIDTGDVTMAGALVGDTYRAGLFNLNLSAMDANADGCVELPLVSDPTTLPNRCNANGTSADSPQATKQQVIRHLITHEVGHATGVNLHTTDTTDLMYQYTINWIRDSHFSPAASGLVQIHNGGLQ